ncbi:MAG: hypothetical protein AVDCRST_MAG59-2133, partial [uncultured Thermomicrobiales bacterium]
GSPAAAADGPRLPRPTRRRPAGRAARRGRRRPGGRLPAPVRPAGPGGCDAGGARGDAGAV